MNVELSTRFRRYFQCEYIIPVGSGTAGLFLSLKSFDVKNKKVIIPALMCPHVVIAVLAAGGIPTVADVSPADGNISADSVAALMDDKVGAIIAVDGFGYPANMQKLKELAAPFNCKVIDDACQAYGGMVDGDIIGCRGDMGIISFGYAKPISLQGGGLLLTRSQEIFKKINDIKKMFSFQSLALEKSRLALELISRNPRHTHRYISVCWGLTDFGFPPQLESDLLLKWDIFERDLREMKSNLRKVRDLISKFRDFETFHYIDGDWLPWRYSFLIPDSKTRGRFVKSAKKVGLSCSRLYRPLTEYFNNIEMSDNHEARSSDSISSSIYNLRYQTDMRSTEDLISRVSLLHGRW